MPINARAVPILSDNYAWLLHDESSGTVGIVDPADAKACIAAIEQDGGKLDMILITHHHDDHIAGVDEVRAKYGATVVGATADKHRLPLLDQAVAEGDRVAFGQSHFEVIDTPGHTRGHISYFSPDGDILLCADTLFSLGCGRLLEGTAKEMFDSLQKLAKLPDDTLVCCGHEYTQSNARFAVTVEPENGELRQRAAEVDRLRAEGKATVPSTLGAEKAENPFLRARSAESLAKIRTAKDTFK